MMNTRFRSRLLCSAALLLASFASGQTLTIDGAVKTPLHFTAEEFAKLPHQTVSVVNPHEKKKEQYSGVPLRDLLDRAGVPGGEALGARQLNTYLEFIASDGYKIVYSLGEVDPGVGPSDVLIADQMDGKPLPEGQGPFKAIASKDKRPARWIRLLTTISVRQAQ